MDIPFLTFRKLRAYEDYSTNLAPHASGRSHAPSMGDNMSYTSGALSTFSIKVIIITTCLLFVLIFSLFVNLFSHWFLRRLLSSCSSHADSTCKAHTGLEKNHLDALPTTIYVCEDAHLPHAIASLPQHVDVSLLQCPICLNEFQDGDQIRVLPRCQHDFHVTCIDMWLAKNSSCPTCRGNL